MKRSPTKGDVYEDRDPRADGRRLVVTAVGKRYARAVSTTGRCTAIRIERLTDPKLFAPVPT